MGVNVATNIANSDLFFGYDTGFNVANNDTGTIFYPGRATTNLLSSTEAFDDTNEWARSKNSGSTPTVTANTSDNPLGGIYSSKADKVYIPGDGTYPRISQNFTPASTNTHTFSVWIRSLSGNCRIYLIAFRNSPWNSSGGAHKNLTSEWQRVSFSFTPPDTTSHQIYMGAHDDAVDKGNTLEFWGAQMEENSNASPYTATSRSDTTGLIDLKRTKTLDLGDVGFTSGQQLDFDGTDDKIELGNHLNTIGSEATFDMVFKSYSTNDSFKVMIGWGHGTSNYSHISIGNLTSGYNDESLHVVLNSNFEMYVREGHTKYKDNEYHHLSVTLGTNNYSIWIDGVEKTFTFAQGSQTSHFPQIVGYNSNITARVGQRIYTSSIGPFEGEIPVMKVYKRILTDEEMKQNYKAYKNRFGI
jgi:hypothetical protein